MRTRKPHKFAGIATFLMLATGLCIGRVHAQEVSASLSNPITQVGNPVHMNVVLTGISGAQLPPTIDVEGLKIVFTNRSRNVQIINMNMTMTDVFTYTVVPTREGDFTIPSLQIRSGNKRFRTEPLKLRVAGVSQRPITPNMGGMPSMPNVPMMPNFGQPMPQPPQRRQPASEREFAFAEIQLAKTSCYAGETIPVKLKFFIESRVSCRFNEPPIFRGEGFTTARLTEPEQGTEEVNGIPYNTLTFATSITPVKSGDLAIDPVKFTCIVNEGGGMGNMDEIFAQFFGQNAPQGFGGARQIGVSSNPVKLVVKALPAEGKPENFSGAIGEFALYADASPRKVGPGEPVTMKLTLNGKGNFDALSAPTLINTDGWRTYTPKDSFISADGSNLSGKKTFEYLLIAQEAKQGTPGADFSYFNPAQGKYVTLTTQGVNVQAQAPGAAAPVPTNTAATDNNAPSAPTPAPQTASVDPNAAPPIAIGATAKDFSFKSPVWDRRFLAAQGVALLLLVVVAASAIWRRMQSGEKAQRRELQKLAGKKLRHLARETGDRKQFYQNAIAYLSEETGARTGRPAGEITMEDVIASGDGDAETSHGIREIYQSNDEMVYGHIGLSNGAVTPEERERVVGTLQRFNSTHAL